MAQVESDPTISVVCPTYNSARFALWTLETVVTQTRPAFEIVVSDDGSTDGTPDIVGNFLAGHSHLRAWVIRNAHRGPGAARNSGIQQARGEWIAFIDSDDLWDPRKLEVMASAIRTHPEANLVCHSEEHVRRDGSRRLLDYGSRFDPRQPVAVQQYCNNLFSPSAVTCSRSLLLEAGLFDESLPTWQDYELWLRMAPVARPLFLRQVLGYYCERDGSITAGSLWRQWKSAMQIAVRHREKVATSLYLYRLLRMTGSFGIRGLRQVWKGNLRRPL
ncbi:MAG: glycosyltransferase [Candidatus Eremiobacterota bacterium]